MFFIFFGTMLNLFANILLTLGRKITLTLTIKLLNDVDNTSIRYT